MWLEGTISLKRVTHVIAREAESRGKVQIRLRSFVFNSLQVWVIKYWLFVLFFF